MMTRELAIENLTDTYARFGITEELAAYMVDTGADKYELNYQFVYLTLDSILAIEFGIHRYYSTTEIAEAFECSEEEASQMIEESIGELVAEGANPDDYMVRVAPTDSKYLM